MNPSPDKSVSPPNERFSLHRLSAAFARLTGAAPPDESPSTTSEDVTVGMDGGSDDRQILSPRMVVEGMLFVGHADGRPLTSRSMAAQIRDVSPQEVDSIIVELNAEYDRVRSAYHIVSEGAGYRLQLREEHEPLRQRFSGRSKQVKLTPQAVEVLSVIAYRQPVTTEDLAKARGSRSDALVNQLIRRDLVKVERPGGSSKPLYRTTQRFNDLVGIKTPADLPRSEDLDDN